MNTKIIRITTLVAVLVLCAAPLHAACVNKYVARTEGNKKVFILLTGLLTFDEAKDLGKQIIAKDAQPVEWVDQNGKTLSTAVRFQAVRPMPVKCADKPSGSVVNVTFLTFASPSKSVRIKFSETLTVEFQEQAK